MNPLLHTRPLLLCIMLLLIAPLMANAQESHVAAYVAGKDYIVLEQPVRTRDSSKVEVVEVFWYGCSHCYHFESLVQKWHEAQPDDVDFWQSPAMWNDLMKAHAQMFFTAEVLGVKEKVHNAIFTVMNVERKRLARPSEIEDLFADYGVDRAKFKSVFKSFGVNSQVKQADARARSYKVGGTPELVVNGKYRVSATLAGGQPQMLQVVDYLVNKERALLATP